MQRNLLLIIVTFAYNMVAQTLSDLEKGIELYEDYCWQDAEAYLLKAADAGSGEAYFLLGDIYENVVRFCSSKEISDREKALNMYLSGANRNDYKSMAAASKLLLWKNTPTDSALAHSYIRMSADKNIGSAYLRLAETAKTYVTRLENYLKAEQLGEKPYFELYQLYAYEWKSTFDRARALHYVEKMFYEQETDELRAMWLGNEYIKNNNYKQASKYLKYMYGQHTSDLVGAGGFYLGLIFKNGDNGITKDEDLAQKCLTCYANSHTKIKKIPVQEIGRKIGYQQFYQASDMLGDYYSHRKKPAVALFHYINSPYEHNEEKSRLVNAYERTTLKKYKETGVIDNEDYKSVVALCHEKGFCNIAIDTVKAIRLYRECARRGDVESMVHLANILTRQGKSELKGEAITLYKEAALKGDIYSLFKVKYDDKDLFIECARKEGMVIAEKENELKRLERLESKSAYMQQAQIYFDFYTKGYEFVSTYSSKKCWVKDDKIDAIFPDHLNSSLEKAAECYYKAGEYEKAISCLNQSDKLLALGQTYLALCYYYGRGVKADERKALSMLKDASKLYGGEIAMAALGNHYRRTNDYLTAVRWYKRAAYWGSKEGMRNLALCYARGLGVEKNEKLADLWMKEAAKHGDNDASTVIN